MTAAQLRAKAEKYAVAMSEARLNSQGGYPDEWAFRIIDGVDTIIIASVDHDEAPTLTIAPVCDFVTKHQYWDEDAIMGEST